ncbi:hypothetical protein F5Y10DRAFT_249673 [Nemania abortiva]|nr:hypothetical protein F5Y10DRAFT_249673 [Nemania abortiva]
MLSLSEPRLNLARELLSLLYSLTFSLETTMSISPTPTYHLCPVFHIAPPIKGHLDLGTVLPELSAGGVNFPRNGGRPLAEVPRDQIFPRLGEEAYDNWQKGEGDTLADDLWDVKGGVTRSVGQLRSLEGNIWGKAPGGVAGKLNWLCERSSDDTIKIDKILTRYFIPTEEYMEAVFQSPNAKPKTDRRGKRLPLYMITGLMIAVGFSMSKAKGTKKHAGGEIGAGSEVGIGGGYKSENTASTDIESSSNIVLGFRLRKIFWEGDVVQMTDDVAGQTLGKEESAKEPDIIENLKIIDDFDVDEGSKQDVFVVKEGLGGIEPSKWVLP